MKTLVEFINEWKEDLGNQVIMIMGTPGCGKTYWMQHNGIQFFKKQGITLNPKELDIDHTLKTFQIIDFPKFCDRVIKYKSTSVMNKKGSVHNNKNAWKTFIDNEKERYTKLNKANKGLDTNIPDLDKLDYEFIAPWLTRYENASSENKSKVFDEFTKVMFKEYFNKVFASDFSVRDEAKEQYNKDFIEKLGNKNDAFVAISGAKFKTIKEIADICKENNTTCRIVYLNGSVEKAVGQDARRERSGGADFVIDYAEKINKVWDKLIDSSADEYYKNNNIYTIYEFEDTNADDIMAYPAWSLKKIYK
jgi:hypothetical protein